MKAPIPLNRDDSFWPRDLELEVHVDRDGYELCVAWPIQDGVVRPREVHHLEGEHLDAKHRSAPEVTGRSIYPDFLHAEDDLVEGRTVGV